MNWRKPTYSGNGGENCVEVADDTRNVMIRDTKEHPLGSSRTVLTVAPDTWRTFVKALR